MDKTVEIVSKRFLLRELTLEDVTERYLDWLCDVDAKKNIISATKTKNISDLRRYVSYRIGRSDILFLGIFDKNNGLHIGNIKYEPINSDAGFAIMGIFIGDVTYRGQGVMKEVVRISSQWLQKHRRIDQILLGVTNAHHIAIRAYEKLGFRVAKTPYIPNPLPGAITMVWSLPSFNQHQSDGKLRKQTL